MKPRIYSTRELPPEVISELKRRFRLDWNRRDRPVTRRELLQAVDGAEGLITMLNDSIDAAVMAAAPKLRIIANYAVGYNNIDVVAASRRGIDVTNTPGVLTEATADLTWALILATARRLHEGEALVRSGRWTGWAPTQLVGGEIYGKTIGIIGMGRIGQAVARRAQGFAMDIIYHSRNRLPLIKEVVLGARYQSLKTLLHEADVVTLHLPLTNESRHVIGQEALQWMKPTAYLINTARGPVVDEKALLKALARKQIAGAGFDVYEEEPRVPAALRRLNNVVLLPHLGSAARETRVQMGMMVIDNLAARFAGHEPPNKVN
ncbi:MAG TPA: D-glycerate dehydrogenase [Nitrospiria bacterium]|nr:D-glycerate dehydrogenase [Nitrospiria bacterium]